MLTAAEWPIVTPLRHAFRETLPTQSNQSLLRERDQDSGDDATELSNGNPWETITARSSQLSILPSRSLRRADARRPDESVETPLDPSDAPNDQGVVPSSSSGKADVRVFESSLTDVDQLFQPWLSRESMPQGPGEGDELGRDTEESIFKTAVFDESEPAPSIEETGHARESRRMRRAARAGPACPPGTEPCGPLERLFPAAYVPPCGDFGIGHERVMFAPFFIHAAKPFTHIALQYDQGWGVSKPDRSEFFWAAPPTGRGAESSVDVITLRARMETAAERASAIIDVPMRAIDPEINKNTAGIGDLVTGGKVVLVDGRDWVVTQQTLTSINTGPAGRGLGSGHVSIEPGLLVRYRWSDETYLHGQLRYVIPVAGTDNYAGEVLIWGIGLSKIWYETDAFALLPTFEIVGTSFLDGQRTTAAGLTADVDGETTIEFLPGLRFVLGPQGDLGLPELGLSGGVSAGDEGWFTGRMLLEARWSF